MARRVIRQIIVGLGSCRHRPPTGHPSPLQQPFTATTTVSLSQLYAPWFASHVLRIFVDNWRCRAPVSQAPSLSALARACLPPRPWIRSIPVRQARTSQAQEQLHIYNFDRECAGRPTTDPFTHQTKRRPLRIRTNPGHHHGQYHRSFHGTTEYTAECQHEDHHSAGRWSFVLDTRQPQRTSFGTRHVFSRQPKWQLRVRQGPQVGRGHEAHEENQGTHTTSSTIQRP